MFFFMREYITVSPASQSIHRRPIRQFHVETETYSRGEVFRRNNVSAKLKRRILTKQQVHFRPFHSEMPSSSSSSSVKNVLLIPEGTWLSASPRQVGNTCSDTWRYVYLLRDVWGFFFWVGFACSPCGTPRFYIGFPPRVLSAIRVISALSQAVQGAESGHCTLGFRLMGPPSIRFPTQHLLLLQNQHLCK